MAAHIGSHAQTAQTDLSAFSQPLFSVHVAHVLFLLFFLGEGKSNNKQTHIKITSLLRFPKNVLTIKNKEKLTGKTPTKLNDCKHFTYLHHHC